MADEHSCSLLYQGCFHKCGLEPSCVQPGSECQVKQERALEELTIWDLLCLCEMISEIWQWNSNTFATWCKELTHWKRPRYWEGLGAGGEGDDRGWDGWMSSPAQWTWVWVNSGSLWGTGRPGALRFMGSQRVGHDWATELNWRFQNEFSFDNSMHFIFMLILF